MKRKTRTKPKLIVITGTPGVGKSTTAKILVQKLSFARLDLHRYYSTISIKYNQKKHCYDIDNQKFKKLVEKKFNTVKNGLIVDSHIAHHLPRKLVDLCIVLICSDLKELEKRLKQRKYSTRKIRENLDAEIFQVCLLEAKGMGHKMVVVDTAEEKAEKIAREIQQRVSWINGKPF